jgi:hypothetical protein
MCGAIPLLPDMPSWCGAQFKKKSTGTTLPVPLGTRNWQIGR